MTWTAFPTWVVGQVSLASDWNTYVANNMQFLATPPFGHVIFASQSISSGASTQASMTSGTVSTGGGVTTSSNNFVVPVAGTYQIMAQAGYAPGIVSSYWACSIVYNSVLYLESIEPGAASGYTSPNITTLYPNAAANGTFGMFTQQNSGSGETMYGGADNPSFPSSYLSILKVSN
jgi:hypothetical protein